jgi:hypothetical protein
MKIDSETRTEMEQIQQPQGQTLIGLAAWG